MLKKFFHLESFTARFVVRFVVALIVFGKWEFSAGLQIHPKEYARHPNKALKECEKNAQGA